MSYTAAMLSYMIQHSPKPIVLTGSQQPIDKEDTDGRINLRDSFLYAASDTASDVIIVFQGKVIAGTRAKKIRTKSFNAFASVDLPNLGVIRDGRIIQYITTPKQEKPAKAAPAEKPAEAPAEGDEQPKANKNHRRHNNYRRHRRPHGQGNNGGSQE